MATPRKAKTPDAGARHRLIEATAKLMRDEGYAAATSRRVAAEAGVKQALVYYYFPTMDDLFVEVLRAGADSSLQKMRAALTDDDPLRALWEMNSDSRLTGLNTEFMALANHRKAIRSRAQSLRRTCARHRDRRRHRGSAGQERGPRQIPADRHRRCSSLRRRAACATRTRSASPSATTNFVLSSKTSSTR